MSELGRSYSPPKSARFLNHSVYTVISNCDLNYETRRLSTIFVHSYRQPEVVVIYLDMAKMTILVMLKCEIRWA